MQIIEKPISEVIPYEKNPRRNDAAVDAVAKSIEQFGFKQPIVIDADGVIVAGHTRLKAAKKLKLKIVPCVLADDLTPEQIKAYRIADNSTNSLAEWDVDLLLAELADLPQFDFTEFGLTDIDELLNDINDQHDTDESNHQTLAERFLFAPFTVFDSRRGEWVNRKKAWISLGLKSENGRGELLTYSLSAQPPEVYKAKEAYEKKNGAVSWERFAELFPEKIAQTGTSIFDPVLCEIAYKWFGFDGAKVIDPFAGGSVRGVVAAYCGLEYTGIDLRAEQVEANRRQAEGILSKDNMPVWIEGNSLNISSLAPGEYDLLFSCPPYYDLEVYSDKQADLSNMGTYAEFVTAYREIIARSAAMLKDNRFAVWVVGDVRDKKGFYYNFVSDTIAAFRAAGMMYYNEAILITQAGSLAIRINKQFGSYRKLGKTHQNVLVFYKGDVKAIPSIYGEIKIDADLLKEDSE